MSLIGGTKPTWPARSARSGLEGTTEVGFEVGFGKS